MSTPFRSSNESMEAELRRLIEENERLRATVLRREAVRRWARENALFLVVIIILLLLDGVLFAVFGLPLYSAKM
jgi:hypothetical protein